MRTNVVLDDELIREAFSLTGIRTKRELIHTALQELVRKHKMTFLIWQVKFNCRMILTIKNSGK